MGDQQRRTFQVITECEDNCIPYIHRLTKRAYTAETLNNHVGKMTCPIDVNQSPSTATPVLAQ